MNLKIFKEISEKASSDNEILAVIIFGSYLHSKNYRDIDICLCLSPYFHGDCLKKQIEYSSIFPEKFDFSIFQSLPLYIKNRVVKEGFILLNKNYDQLFDLFVNTIKDYGLFLPHLNLYLEVD